MLEKLPRYHFTWSRNAGPHAHSALNADRALAENHAWEYGLSLARNRDIARPAAIDGGGNAGRHQRAKRNVHVARPLLFASDVHRVAHAERHIREKRACTHNVCDCDCIKADFYLLVDSIYYLDADRISGLCAKATTNVVVGVYHEFKHAYGSFGGGEAVYTTVGPDRVIMHVNGNDHPYDHSTMPWLHASHHDITVGSPAYVLGFRSLCWTRVASTADHVVTSFMVSKTSFKRTVEAPAMLAGVLQNANYYGGVLSMSASASTNLPGELLNINIASTWSFGDFLMVYDNAKKAHIYAPKAFVASGIRFMAMRKRDETTLGLLVQHLRGTAKNFNIPDALVGTAIVAAACLAYVHDIDFTVAALHGAVRPHITAMSALNSALSLNFQHIWRWYHAAGAILVPIVVGAMTSLLTHAVIRRIAPSAPRPSMLPAWVGVGAFALGSAVALAMNGFSARDIFAAYRVNRASNAPTDAAHEITRTVLPATKPSKPVEELLDMPIDAKATVNIRDLIEKESTTKLLPLGIIQTTCIPVASDNGVHATLSAVVERAAAPQPVRGPLFEDLEFKKFDAWVRNNIDAIMTNEKGEKLEPVRGNYAEWNEHQPSNLRPLNDRAASELDHGRYNEQTTMHITAFPKVENTTKSTVEGVPSFKTRCIQGRDIHFKVLTGPFIYALTKAVYKIFNKDNSVTYAAGVSALNLGMGAANAFESFAAAVVFESDQSSFDMTIHEFFIALETWVFERYGATETMLQCWADTAKGAPASSRAGVSYTVEATRRSGDNHTSLGNSLITIFVVLYMLSGRGFKSYDQIRGDIKLMVMGDDNHAVVSGSLAESIGLSVGSVTTTAAQLGLVTKAKIYDGPNALWMSTFLSSRFYPARMKTANGYDEVTFLGPSIGRTYLKYGYYINIPERFWNATVRGDAMGRKAAHEPIPFLRELTAALLRATKEIVATTRFLGHVEHRIAADDALELSENVWVMLNVVYGLDKTMLTRYTKMLRKIKKLPGRVDYQPLHRAAVIDGCVERAGSDDDAEAVERL